MKDEYYLDDVLLPYQLVLTLFAGWGVDRSISFRFLERLHFQSEISPRWSSRIFRAIRPTSESSPLNLMALSTMRSRSASRASIDSYLSLSSFKRIVFRSRASFLGMTSWYCGMPRAIGSTGSRNTQDLIFEIRKKTDAWKNESLHRLFNKCRYDAL